MLPMDGNDEDNNPLVDQKALKEIIERATDALRPVGLTLLDGSVQAMMDPQSGAMMLTFAAQIRPKAATELVEDMESRKEFNRMQAQRHDEMVDAKAQQIRDLINNADGDVNLMAEGDIETETCPTSGAGHRLHPSTGHCLDCGSGLEV